MTVEKVTMPKNLLHISKKNAISEQSKKLSSLDKWGVQIVNDVLHKHYTNSRDKINGMVDWLFSMENADNKFSYNFEGYIEDVIDRSGIRPINQAIKDSNYMFQVKQNLTNGCEAVYAQRLKKFNHVKYVFYTPLFEGTQYIQVRTLPLKHVENTLFVLKQLIMGCPDKDAEPNDRDDVMMNLDWM